jgi:hypothetical protein
MEEWFYVKNDLVEREDIKGVIQRPIWSHFDIRRPATALGNEIETCQRGFNTVCTFIGTRDLVQEHIAYRVWPLVNDWEMSKEADAGSIQGGFVYLKYTFRYREQFDEPNDEWLNCIEATSDELLGAYTRAEDDAMTVAFGERGKKRLNRVFNVIGFEYPDYSYPLRRQGKKRKFATSAISVVPNGKKIKVLTHRPRYIEMTIVSKLAEMASSTAEPGHPASASSKGESAEVPKTPITESAEALKHSAEAKGKAAEKLELGELTGLQKILGPLPELESLKVSKAPTITSKRRRMASVLDAVLESTRVSTPAPAKETAEAATAHVETEARPPMPTKIKPTGTGQSFEQGPSDVGLALEKEDTPEKVESPIPKAPTGGLDFIIRQASGKKLSEEEIAEAKHYIRELKYWKGALMYNGTNEDDFLYCLPDNKKISV